MKFYLDNNQLKQKYIPIKINNNPIVVFTVNDLFLIIFSVIIVNALFEQLAIMGPMVRGVYPIFY